jgi:hypothetical protein
MTSPNVTLSVRIPNRWMRTLQLLAQRHGATPEQVAEEILANELELQRCRKCGCTQLEACPEGCSWVAEDLCSACVPAPKVRAAPLRSKPDSPKRPRSRR